MNIIKVTVQTLISPKIINFQIVSSILFICFSPSLRVKKDLSFENKVINILKITKLESVGGEGRQSTVRGSTVNSEVIDDQQSTVRGSMVNSETIDDQQLTVRQLMINTVDC